MPCKTIENLITSKPLDMKDVLDSLPCYFSVLDHQLHFLLTNQAFKNDFGGDGIGKLCHSVYKNSSFHCDPCPVLKTFDDGTTHFSEETIQLKNGEICQVFVQTAPLKDNQGSVVAVIELLTNITEIKTQKELSILGHSIALLSHGIKNILEGLQGGSYIVDEGIKDGDMNLTRKGWEIVNKNIFDITDVAQNILYSSKDRPLNYQKVDPNRLAEDTVLLFKDRSLSLGITLTCTPDNSLPLVSVGAASIRRMLQNLVWNAIEACMNDPSFKSQYIINVRTGFHDEGCFKFEVKDNGMGMDENTRHNIFEDFFSTKGGKGTGLGLSVVKKIANRHGGTIEIESTPGEGSLFRIFLPIGIK